MDFLEYADITSEVNGAMVNSSFFKQIFHVSNFDISRNHNLQIFLFKQFIIKQ